MVPMRLLELGLESVLAKDLDDNLFDSKHLKSDRLSS